MKTLLAACLQIIIAFLIGTGMTYTQVNTFKADTLKEQLIKVGFHNLFISSSAKQGAKFTVVFESGAGGGANDWTKVRSLLPATVRTIAYDRAGIGKSEHGPLPRTMAQEAFELHQLLKRAKIKGPIILVGQSIGGLLVRLYSERYGKNVVGLVLVDPTHESSVLGSMKYGGWVRLREKAVGKVIPEPQLKSKQSPGYDPTADYMAEEFQKIYLSSAKKTQPLGDRPLIVIGAGKRNQPPGTPDDQWKTLRAERDNQIRELNSLSNNSKFILDNKSGHLIHYDNPEIVAKSIEMVIESIETKTKLSNLNSALSDSERSASPSYPTKMPESLIEKWQKVLQEPKPAEEQVGHRDAQAKRQAEAAIALLQLEQYNLIWPLLKQSPDPSLRSYLIRDMFQAGISADLIINQLRIEKDASIRQALLLALGGFSDKQLPDQKRIPLVGWLLQQYRTDPNPGIHSAIDWLLRYGQQGLEKRKIDWQQQEMLAKIDSSLSGQPSGDKKWYVTIKGHAMAIFDGPIEFIMGSSGNEPGRDKTDIEAKHRQQIPRSFAVATKEVTIAQFQQFFDANPAIKQLAQAAGQRAPTRNGPFMGKINSDERCPQVSITWFEAAQYCNWLSQQEGIPKEEWCYPTLEEIKEGMVLPTNYLHRTGYRMPTEAEWEYVCRAGASTSRFYGHSEELLREYAWYTGTSFNERLWPVGQLKPNTFGLFDMYGSVWEWGQDWVKHYGAESRDKIWVDAEDAILTVSKDYKRPRKGGSFTYNSDFMRSALRNDGYIPDERRDSVGFRVARTLP